MAVMLQDYFCTRRAFKAFCRRQKAACGAAGQGKIDWSNLRCRCGNLLMCNGCMGSGRKQKALADTGWQTDRMNFAT
jgi:hypothetical protein